MLRRSSRLALGIGLATLCLLAAGPALAKGGGKGGRYCTSTASSQFIACQHEVRDDFFTATAICTNLSEKEERSECSAEAKDESREGNQLCREQRDARKELCKALGEERYDPDFEPEDFDDDFANLTNPNPFFPLAIGNHWDLRGRRRDGLGRGAGRDQVDRGRDLHRGAATGSRRTASRRGHRRLVRPAQGRHRRLLRRALAGASSSSRATIPRRRSSSAWKAR